MQPAPMTSGVDAATTALGAKIWVVNEELWIEDPRGHKIHVSVYDAPFVAEIVNAFAARALK